MFSVSGSHIPGTDWAEFLWGLESSSKLIQFQAVAGQSLCFLPGCQGWSSAIRSHSHVLAKMSTSLSSKPASENPPWVKSLSHFKSFSPDPFMVSLRSSDKVNCDMGRVSHCIHKSYPHSRGRDFTRVWVIVGHFGFLPTLILSG